jgi:colanic acid biosynthesis glycosyl transferase WcaI
MKIFIVSCVFPPELVVSSQTSADIAEALSRKGHEVTVVAPFPSRPGGKIIGSYRRKLYARERSQEGYELVRCFSLFSARSSMVSRFLENISFGLTAACYVFISKRPHLIYSNNWPILATGILSIVSRLRRIPMIASIQDVYPESLVSQKRIRSDGIPAKIFRWVDGKVAAACREIIVISSCFKEIYRDNRRINSHKIHVVSNWVDGNSIIPDDSAASEIRESFGFGPGCFVIGYGGNIGVAAGVETIIEAMGILTDIPSVRLLIAGEGSRLEFCRKLADKLHLTPRIAFCSPWRRSRTSAVYAAADVLVLPTNGRQSQYSVPSKLIAYLLSGRSIIALAIPDTEVAQIVRASESGWIIDPNDPSRLAAAIRQAMQASREERQVRGQSGRQYALQNLVKNICVPRVVEILERASVSPNRSIEKVADDRRRPASA